jgi:transcriptional regulator with XRE-family HTH domain
VGTNRRPRPRKLARKLHAIRMQLHLSQAEMADKLNTKQSPVYPTHISEFERDLREPSLLVLLGYARLISISTDVLIDDAAELPRK